MHFIQNLSLSFHSFLDLHLNGSMGVAHPLTTIGGIDMGTSYSVENLQLSFCLSSLLKAHMNLNGIQRLYGLMG